MQCTLKNQYRRSSINKVVLCIDRLKSWLVHEKKKQCLYSCPCTKGVCWYSFAKKGLLTLSQNSGAKTIEGNHIGTAFACAYWLRFWSCLRPLGTTPKQVHRHLYSKHAKNVISPLFNSSLRFYGKSVEKKKHENPFRSKVHSENEKHFRGQTH